MKIIEDAILKGEKTLSEFDSKRVLSAYGIPVTKECLVQSLADAKVAALDIGYPVVLKGSASKLTHKTEFNLIELNIRNENELETAYQSMTERGKNIIDGILVQQMIKGEREFVAGLITDPQLGPCVMFGLGGIYTEVLKDVTFRVAPLTTEDALEMMTEIKARKLLEPFRGKPAVNKDILAGILKNLGSTGLEIPDIAEIDINPLIIHDGVPIAVDALVVLRNGNK